MIEQYVKSIAVMDYGAFVTCAPILKQKAVRNIKYF